MNDEDHSSPPKGSLKSEWTLLLESFIEDDIPIAKKIKGLPQVFIQETMRNLSEQKKSLFQKIESVKEQIEETQTVIENLQLVGSDTQEAFEKIAQLHDEGKNLTELVFDLDKKIKKVRILTN